MSHNYIIVACSSLFDLSYWESVAFVFRLSLSHITLDIATSEDPNAAEVVKISTGVSYCAEYSHYLMNEPSSGQLYLVRPGNIRSSRECMYGLSC